MLTAENQPRDPDAVGCLQGATAWLITSGKAGMVVQAKGIAEALGLHAIEKRVEPHGIWRLMAPWGPVAPSERFGQSGSAFAPPWPDVAIAVGRASIPYIRRLRRAAGPTCYTIVLQDPRSGPDTADLIWVPAHDKRRGPNVIATVISPHGYTLEQLEALRRQSAPTIDALPAPRVAVILGGRNAVYRYSDEDDQRLARSLASIAARGASFLITASRRSHPALIEAVDRATKDAPRILWRGDQDGANPYPEFLARADHFIVTADSVNMTGEVCATGKPVHVFHPSGGSAKFNRFHQSLESFGATRPLPPDVGELANWSYPPQVTADLIAHEIERRVHARRRALPGLG